MKYCQKLGGLLAVAAMICLVKAEPIPQMTTSSELILTVSLQYFV